MTYENKLLCQRKLWHHIVRKEHFHKRGVERGVILGDQRITTCFEVFFVILRSYDLVELAGAPPFPPPFFEKCFFQKYEAWAISRTKNHPFRLSGCWDRPANIWGEKRPIFSPQAHIFEIWKSCKWVIFVDFEVPMFSGLYINEKWR